MRLRLFKFLVLLISITLSACSIGIRDNLRISSHPAYYQVRSGDTLYDISRKVGVPVQDIALLNGIRNPNDIRVGDRVIVGYESSVSVSKEPVRGYASVNSQSVYNTSLTTPPPNTSKQPPITQGNEPKEEIQPSDNSVIGWPVRNGRVVSKFGPRSGSFHDGIDIAAPIGTPIYAANSGQVIYSGNKLSGYGNLIIVRAANGITTVYAHNRRNIVKEKQYVKRGDKIAEVGSTGRSSGPHVHFEVRTKDKKGRYIAVDPIPLLSKTSSEKPRYRVNERLAPILAKVFK